MGQRAPDEIAPPAAPLEPGLRPTLLVALAVLLGLLANGRPIGAGDTRPTEYTAASLVSEGNLTLDEYGDVVAPPFAQDVGGHRVSTYPVVSAVLAAPVFLLARGVFLLDETGTAVAGKVAASLFSALAAAVLFRAVSRRRPLTTAALVAFLFAFGTSVWSTSQALWQHPAAVLCLAVAVLFTLRAEFDPAWAGRAGLPLALAVAARHADVALVAAFAVALAVRWPRQVPRLVAWAAPVVVLQVLYQWSTFGSPLRHGFTGSLGRFSEPWGTGHLGLLVSPAKGLLVFTPLVIVALVGVARALRHRTDVQLLKGPEGFESVTMQGSRGLALTVAAAVAAHWLLMGRWSEWHGGESFGPRMMTDALPLLLVFLPDGLDALPTTGLLLGALSVGVQALGAFSYDYRWERMYQRPPDPARAELWRVEDSPIPFHLRERVAMLAVPLVREGRIDVREHRRVLGGDSGSRLAFGPRGPVLQGVDATFEDVHLLRGARVVEGSRLRLQGRWDGIFLRVRNEPPRGLELRIRGRGQGVLYVGEQSTLGPPPRWAAFEVDGPIRVDHRYDPRTANGGDLVVTTGRSPGRLEIDSIALVAPEDAERPLQLGPP